MVTLKLQVSNTNVALALWREEDFHFNNHNENNKDNNRLFSFLMLFLSHFKKKTDPH